MNILSAITYTMLATIMFGITVGSYRFGKEHIKTNASRLLAATITLTMFAVILCIGYSQANKVAEMDTTEYLDYIISTSNKDDVYIVENSITQEAFAMPVNVPTELPFTIQKLTGDGQVDYIVEDYETMPLTIDGTWMYYNMVKENGMEPLVGRVEMSGNLLDRNPDLLKSITFDYYEAETDAYRGYVKFYFDRTPYEVSDAEVWLTCFRFVLSYIFVILCFSVDNFMKMKGARKCEQLSTVK